MSINRLVDTDDSGSGTDGTIHNNAWLQSLQERIDQRWSEYTITSTGTQNNLSITSSSLEADVVRCNNASLLSLTGIAAPASPEKPGKTVLLLSVGAGAVQLLDQNGNSTNVNRFITGTATTLSLAPGLGWALLVYDDTNNSTTDRWRVIGHEQGEWLDYTPTWTAATTNPTLGNGALTGKYYQRGKYVSFHLFLTIGSSTTIGSGTYTFTLPYTINGSLIGIYPGMILDSGTTRYAAFGIPSSSTTFTVGVNGSGTDVAHNAPMTWDTGDQLRIHGELIL